MLLPAFLVHIGFSMEMLMVMFLGMSSWGEGWAGRSEGNCSLSSGGWPGGRAVFQQVHSVSRLMATSLCIWFNVGEEGGLWVELSEDWITAW